MDECSSSHGGAVTEAGRREPLLPLPNAKSPKPSSSMTWRLNVKEFHLPRHSGDHPNHHSFGFERLLRRPRCPTKALLKGDKQLKRNTYSTESNKYMSRIKISEKQHELVKSMKQTGKSIQSRSLNRVLGNLDNIHLQSYEVFIKEEQKKLHEHWLQLVKQDLPVAYANWTERNKQRNDVIISLVLEIKDKHVFLISLFGFIVLHMLMYAANIYVWSILANLDMEMDPDTKEYKAFTELIPLILVLIVIVMLSCPFNIMYCSSRLFFLTCLFHCICAPLYKVTLPDFFLADQFTSQVQALRSSEFYYYGWGDFKHRQNTCKSSSIFTTFSFIVAVIPYRCCFLQVLNVLLRFAWLQTVSDFKVNFLRRQAMISIIASLEIIRRGIWNFFCKDKVIQRVNWSLILSLHKESTALADFVHTRGIKLVHLLFEVLGIYVESSVLGHGGSCYNGDKPITLANGGISDIVNIFTRLATVMMCCLYMLEIIGLTKMLFKSYQIVALRNAWGELLLVTKTTSLERSSQEERSSTFPPC
ncbi:hypothetical protein K1719_022531 [Acacia pycnantha]|nr:hypothetical protein K1719_022531 [Acacia pycnantha]